MGVLHLLIRKGDVEAVRAMLAADPSLANKNDERGQSPLSAAVCLPKANRQLVELLVKHGAEVNFVWTDSAGYIVHSHDSVIRAAIRQGDFEVVKLLHQHGADLAYVDENGYTAMLDAAYSQGDGLEIVRYLIALGHAVNVRTKYNETPLMTAYRFGRFDIVGELLNAGAADTDLAWTPLIRAAAMGTIADLRNALDSTTNVDEKDTLGRTALHAAALRGDVEIAQALVEAGANLLVVAEHGTTAVAFAAERGHAPMADWLVGQGCHVDTPDSWGHTALAAAAERGHHEVVATLLRLGADPNSSTDRFRSIAEAAADRRTLELLLDAGADEGRLGFGAKRLLMGLEDDQDALLDVAPSDYVAHRYAREGNANPEDMTNPFWLAMVRGGGNAWSAREYFEDPASFACGLGGYRQPAVWSAERFGQSCTRLPDGRVILIAGEHEDSYDPDFCIYNDVFVVQPDGQIRIFGYPFQLFPPTDFHSATLLDDWIYVIGSLGYVQDRAKGMEVYRLSTNDYHIELLPTTGTKPPRLFEHRARLLSNSVIQVDGGTAITLKGKKEDHRPNDRTFLLDVQSRTWFGTHPAPQDLGNRILKP